MPQAGCSARSLKAARYGHLERVAPGPRRTLALGGLQHDADREAVSLGWRADGGQLPEHMYPTDPMVYLDGLAVGAVALPEQLAAIPPAVLLDIVAQAPALRGEQRNGVAGRMIDLGLDGLLPAPASLEVRERRDIAPVPHLMQDSLQIPTRRDWDWRDIAILTFDYDGLSTEGIDEPVLLSVLDGGVDVIARRPASPCRRRTIHCSKTGRARCRRRARRGHRPGRPAGAVRATLGRHARFVH